MWEGLKYKIMYDQEIKSIEEKIYDLKDIFVGTGYDFCRYLALSSVLDKNQRFRDKSLYFLKQQFPDGALRRGYLEERSVYLKIKGIDGLLRTFFVGDFSDYPLPSDNPVPFNFDST